MLADAWTNGAQIQVCPLILLLGAGEEEVKCELRHVSPGTETRYKVLALMPEDDDQEANRSAVIQPNGTSYDVSSRIKDALGTLRQKNEA
jgi:hypothetical protein